MLHLTGPPTVLLALFSLTCEGLMTRAPVTYGPDISQYAVGDIPEVKYKLPRSWAGSIPVPGTSNDDLFFWFFESETTEPSNDLIIWLDGGPGCSSLGGETLENGPLYFGHNTKPTANPNSWTKLANVLYIDQPVGTGYSSGSSAATSNDQLTDEFYLWLKAFYAKFPVLKSYNTYFMGESYAGVYIPYFTQKILDNSHDLPLNIKSITMGSPMIGNYAAMFDAAIVKYMTEYNEVLKIPAPVLKVFQDDAEICGFDKVWSEVSYPGKQIQISGDPEGYNYKKMKSKLRKRQAPSAECAVLQAPVTPAQVNQSILGDCFEGCATWGTAIDYLTTKNPIYSEYNIRWNLVTTPGPSAVAYFNRPAVRKAIHAPTKTLAACNETVYDLLDNELVQPPAYSILPSLIQKSVRVHLYNGEYDMFTNFHGTEMVIQNMTWRGHTGFQSKPSNNFEVNGKSVGYWGEERYVSYHHIKGAGHLMPYDEPAVGFAYVRDFVLSRTGYRK